MSVSGENSGGTNMERQSVTMKQRPETERPYEKCLKAGAESLTDGELLAVLIRCGTKNYSALELAFALWTDILFIKDWQACIIWIWRC